MDLFEHAYKKYGENIIWNSISIEDEIMFFLNKYGINISWTFFDVGCWYSKISNWCYLHSKKYFWIDISSIPIKFQEEINKENPNIVFKHINISLLDLDEEMFGCILDIWCFHFLLPKEQKRILEKYHVALEKKWYIILRFFTNYTENNKPLFYFDNIPVWWSNYFFLYNFFKNLNYDILHIIKDSESFFLVDRITLILQKAHYDK